VIKISKKKLKKFQRGHFGKSQKSAILTKNDLKSIYFPKKRYAYPIFRIFLLKHTIFDENKQFWIIWECF
jgi:hypothetical protein